MNAAYRLDSNYFSCSDCGRLTKKPIVLAWEPETVMLCEPCLRLRDQIERRILEVVKAAPKGLSAEAIWKDLETFGVDQDLTEAARLRLLADGRLH